MKHEIIYTGDYALVVNGDEIKKGDWFINTNQKNLYCHDIENYDVDKDYLEKVIGYRPLNHSAWILEGVPLLPEFSQEDDTRDYSLDSAKEFALDHFEGLESKFPRGGHITIKSTQDILKVGVECGHKFGLKQAKETYKYTLSDLKRAFNCGRDEEWKTFTQFIDSLEPKRPKYFETTCDCQECGANKTDLSLDMGCENKIVITTNSRGQKELVGSYIF